MKGKGLKLVISAALVLVLLASVLLSACAPTAAPAPTQPAQPAYTPGVTKAPAQTAAPAKTAAPAPAADVHTWKLQSHVTAGIELDLLHEMGVLVEEMSNGRLVVTAYAGGQLVPTEDQYSAVKTGMIEMSRAAGSYYKGFIPEGDVEAGIPLMWRSLHDVMVIIWDKGMGDILKEAYAEHNTVWLAVGASAPFCFWTREDIGGVDGLKGLKIRSFGLYMEILNDLGAEAVYIPHAETYTAGQTGVIDAGSTAAFAYSDMKFFEIFPHYWSNKWGMPTNNLIANMDAWNELTPDLQSMLEIGCKFDAYNQDREYRQIVLGMEGKLESVWGNTFHVLSDADMAKITNAALPYFDKYAAMSPRMAKMIDIIQDYMREVGYIK